jgi:hypothetical protein
MEEKNKYVGRKAFITGINGQSRYISCRVFTILRYDVMVLYEGTQYLRVNKVG